MPSSTGVTHTQGNTSEQQQELETEPDQAHSHAIINERLAQRRRERAAQSERAARTLDDLNAQRWQLQHDQTMLHKYKTQLIAQNERDRHEAQVVSYVISVSFSRRLFLCRSLLLQ